jgi:hypothetical protein
MPANDELKFQVQCEAGASGRFRVGTDALSVAVGQRIARNGRAEIWDSVIVQCSEEEEGSDVVRVLLCNPDWNEPLQIACVRSRRDDGSLNHAVLFFDLSRQAGGQGK